MAILKSIPQTAPIVVIGSGQAGVSLVRELRKLIPSHPLVLISADAGGFYSKPMLSNTYAKKMPLERLRIESATSLATKLNCEVFAFTHVETINPDQHTISYTTTTTRPVSLHYSSLVLALGALPLKPPIPGLELALTLNHLDDYIHLSALLDEKAKSVAIIGGGLVGCELANDLQLGGHNITLVERAPQLLPKLVPPLIATKLQSHLQQAGISIQTNTNVLGISTSTSNFSTHNNAESKLYLQTDLSDFNADIVISAMGLQPNTALAQAAGLTVAHGIVCDRYLRTSNNAIYALGDCAEVDGKVLPYILPIMEGAKALAATLSGSPTQVLYPCMPVAVKTTAYPLVIAAPQSELQGITLEETVTDTGAKTLYFREQQLVGFCLAGDTTTERQQLAKRCLGVFS